MLVEGVWWRITGSESCVPLFGIALERGSARNSEYAASGLGCAVRDGVVGVDNVWGERSREQKSNSSTLGWDHVMYVVASDRWM